MSRRPIIASVRTGDDAPGRGRSPEAERLREALSHWASGVTVVAASDGDEVVGLTVSAFSSLSLDPPLVLVCLGEQTALLPILVEAGRFTVNFLAEAQRQEAFAFANNLPAPRPLPPHADPRLPGALASLVCSVHATHPGGDHRIVVGAVERVELGPDAPPLLYHRREYGGVR